MVVVVVMLLALLFTLRKLQNGNMLRKSANRMHILETLSVGPRQKIVLIQVDGREVLVGITAQQMTALSPWSEKDTALTPQHELQIP